MTVPQTETQQASQIQSLHGQWLDHSLASSELLPVALPFATLMGSMLVYVSLTQAELI